MPAVPPVQTHLSQAATRKLMAVLHIAMAGDSRLLGPVAADPESGLHVCLSAPTRQSVDAFYAAALSAGGSDNGKPGLRADYGPNYYAAFVVDPDGYRLEAYCGKSG